MLPPCIHGGALLILPVTSGGARRCFQRRRQGISIPAPNRATPRFSSSGIFRLSVRKIVRQETEARPEAVVGIGNREPNGQNSDLEDITGLGAFNENWPGQDMPAGPLLVTS